MTMVKLYFGKNREPSDQWMVRVMNFSQDRSENVAQINYEMVVDAELLSRLTEKNLLEIKEDALAFPHDWAKLGEILVGLDHPTFSELLKTSSNAAKDFLLDMSLDILNQIEMREGQSAKKQIKYVLNTVDKVSINKQQITFEGFAFVLN